MEKKVQEKRSDRPENLVAVVFSNAEDVDSDPMVTEIASSVCSYLNLAGSCNNVLRMSIANSSYPDVRQAMSSAHILILSGVVDALTVDDLMRSKTLGEDGAIKKVIVVNETLPGDLWKDLLCRGVDFVIPHPFEEENFHQLLQLTVSGLMIQRRILKVMNQIPLA